MGPSPVCSLLGPVPSGLAGVLPGGGWIAGVLRVVGVKVGGKSDAGILGGRILMKKRGAGAPPSCAHAHPGGNTCFHWLP